jgi:hypothetical protein
LANEGKQSQPVKANIDLKTFEGFKKAYPQMFHFNTAIDQGNGLVYIEGQLVPKLKSKAI